MSLSRSKERIVLEKNLEVMKMRLIELERNNIKTKEFTENDMLKEIRDIIMEESNKNY